MMPVVGAGRDTFCCGISAAVIIWSVAGVTALPLSLPLSLHRPLLSLGHASRITARTTTPRPPPSVRPSPDEESGNIELSGPAAVAVAPPAGLLRALVGEGEYLLMRKEEEEVACRLPRLRKDLRK